MHLRVQPKTLENGRNALNMYLYSTHRLIIQTSAHRMQVKHSEFLECINSTNKQPLLERSSLSITRYVRWLVGPTGALCDQPPFKDQPDKRCRLCGSEYNTLPEHCRWIWTLGGGTIREPQPDPLSNKKILKASAGILIGRTVTPV